MNEYCIDSGPTAAGRLAGARASRGRRWLTGLLLLAVFAGGPVAAEELVLEVSGHDSRLTDEFEIEGPWLLDWHVASQFENAFGIEISLVDGVFLDHKGMVLKTKYAGAGTRLIHDSGRFRFRVTSSLANWRLRISKISVEEAETMIPRHREKLLGE